MLASICQKPPFTLRVRVAPSDYALNKRASARRRAFFHLLSGDDHRVHLSMELLQRNSDVVVEATRPSSQPTRCRLLALAPNEWDGQWMNRQQILSRLAKDHDVLYSNGPWSVWDREQESFRVSAWRGGYEKRDGVWLDRSPKMLLNWPTHAAWERAVAQVAVARWHRQLAKMGTGPLVAYVFHPRYLPFAQRVLADLLVYSPYDLFSKMPDWSAERSAEEQRLLSLCDLVIASSEPTRAALQRMTTKPVFCVPNGVDAEHFEAGSALPTPKDLAAIPRPRIGYVGSLNRKVDFNLIASIARGEPTWQLVLIGPEGNLDDVARTAMGHCKQLRNVHFLGPRALHELPMNMGALDVALLCYRKDTWMDFGYPLKLHEYLAAGLPVVSTPLPAIRGHRAYFEVADDESSWREAIARALNGRGRSTPEARRAEAHRNTWDARVATINDILATATNGAFSRSPSQSAGVNAR